MVNLVEKQPPSNANETDSHLQKLIVGRLKCAKMFVAMLKGFKFRKMGDESKKGTYGW